MFSSYAIVLELRHRRVTTPLSLARTPGSLRRVAEGPVRLP
ncbi:MAG: hypothetical protein WAW17_14425 [Rhodococcus sp. (in: high G+C Gram-positive bacteria)]